jgi:trimeric autotransporter adhesin
MKNLIAKIVKPFAPLQRDPQRKRLAVQGLSKALGAFILLSHLSQAAGQGTAFTYQGQLQDSGAPANGTYDLTFSLFTVPTGGTLAAGYLTNAATGVSNGLFTVVLDFGPGVFNGTAYWLQIGVRTNGTGAFASLSPRQELTPTPYAIFAEGANAAGLSGAIPTASLSGTYGGSVSFTNPGNVFAGKGSGLTNVNAAALGGLGSGNFWQLGGNNAGSGAFIGTTNNQVLDLRVNNARAMEFQLSTDPFGVYSNAPNVMGGSSVNFMAAGVIGGTIAGGGGNDMSGNSLVNKLQADFSAIGGGVGNTVAGFAATVAGGLSNSIPPGSTYSFVGGGANNTVAGPSATVGGGAGNVSGPYATVGGGEYNGASGSFGTVAGGQNNQAQSWSAVGGGQGNFAGGILASNCTVGGGQGNLAGGSSYNSFATVAGGTGNNAIGPGSFIGGGGFDGNTADGAGNSASGAAAVVGGGLKNANLALYGTIGGGYLNSANGTTGGFLSGGSTVAGGEGNKASTDLATVGGGIFNTASGVSATVPGGSANLAGGAGSFAAGQSAQTTHNGTFIWGDGSKTFTGANVDNAFNVLATGGVLFYNGTNGVHIDGLGNNNGDLDFGLRFGGALSSGEGIASKRTAGGNQFGLDFYTSSNNRMSIDPNGKVGINTTSPSQRLEVNGNYVLIDGAGAGDGAGPIDAYIGGDGSGSDVQIGSMNSGITAVGFWNYAANAWMHISCSSITIHGGADLAEPFQMPHDGKEIPQGAVVVIDDKNPGQLRMSDQSYDSRVAGVVSGANGINPGIQLQQQGALEGGKNVALTGRVYVQADASNGSIKPGDLLTTSSVPGHAMKVTDHAKAQGAILGKAMTGLSDGKGMVLVLVTLQ